VKTVTGILIEIALNLYMVFGNMAILTILVLLVHKHGRSFHLIVLVSISFFCFL
jgi:hypothetical protein